MKNWTFMVFVALAVFACGSGLSGCLDPCRKVACGKGQCVEGKCDCNLGFEGEDCGTPVNAKVNGTYSLTEICFPSGADPYEVVLTPVEGTETQFLYTGVWNETTVDILCVIGETGLDFTFERTELLTTTVGMRETECDYGVISKDGNTIDLIYKIYLPGATQWDDSCTSHLVR